MPTNTILPQAQDRLPNDANAGRVVGVFGLRGELKVAPSRIGEDALATGLELRATLPDGTARALRIRALRLHKGRPLIHFEGVEDADAAAALVGATLTIDRGAVQLAADEYFDDDLVGCALVDPDGAVLGEVVAVEHYPAQDVLVVLRQAQDDTVRAQDDTVRAQDDTVRAQDDTVVRARDDKRAQGDKRDRAIVPLVRAFVKAIDVRAKRISVELPPGLLDAREADEA